MNGDALTCSCLSLRAPGRRGRVVLFPLCVASFVALAAGCGVRESAPHSAAISSPVTPRSPGAEPPCSGEACRTTQNEIDASFATTCALRASGHVECWGQATGDAKPVSIHEVPFVCWGNAVDGLLGTGEAVTPDVSVTPGVASGGSGGGGAVQRDDHRRRARARVERGARRFLRVVRRRSRATRLSP